MNRLAIVLLMLPGCAKVVADPLDIAPDGVSSASVGGGDTGGGSRLKPVSYVGSDGSRFASADAFDSLLGAHCTFLVASDGATRCMPVPTNATMLYADDACTVDLVSPLFECQAHTSRYVSAQFASDECPPVRFRAFKIGNPHYAVSYYAPSGGACYRAGGTRLVVDHEEIPPSDLVELPTVVEGM